MTGSPFFPTFDQLGDVLPIFPLPRVLLLPRGLLPLNIFEPRYVAMVDAALSTDRMIGMLQPMEPTGDAGRHDATASVYDTGCAGRITSFDETDDGRYLITLTGVCRFRIARELEGQDGFRRVRPDWSPFERDLEEETVSLDRDRLSAALGTYFRQHDISANWEAIEETPDERLITSLCMICPLESREKQALLEAPTLAERAELMISLVEMAVLSHRGDETARH